MLSRNLIESFKELVPLENVSKDVTLALQFMNMLVDKGREIETHVRELGAAKGPEQYIPPATQIANVLSSVKVEIAKTGLRSFFRAMDSLHDVLNRLASEAGLVDAALIQHAHQYVQAFDDACEQYSRTPNSASVSRLIGDAGRFITFFQGLSLATEGFSTALSSADAPLSQEEATLELFIDSGDFLEEINKRLDALFKLYQQTAFLVDSSTPPQITHLEVGSVDIKIRGDGKVIGLLEKIIDNFAGYMHRNHTQEGKFLQPITRGKAAIHEMLDLKKELEAAGRPTDKLDDSIDASTAILSKEAVSLLDGARSIKINENVPIELMPVEPKRLPAPVKQLSHRKESNGEGGTKE